MTFAYNIIYVPDVEAALVFYEQAFGLTRRFIAPGGEYGELETGATALAFAAESLIETVLPISYVKNRKDREPAGIEVAFTTDDVGAALQKAEAVGAEVVLRPVVKPWGQTVAYVRDLNGVLVEIGTPMGGGESTVEEALAPEPQNHPNQPAHLVNVPENLDALSLTERVNIGMDLAYERLLRKEARDGGYLVVQRGEAIEKIPAITLLKEFEERYTRSDDRP